MRISWLLGIALLSSCAPAPEARFEGEVSTANSDSNREQEEDLGAMEGFSWVVDQQLAAMPKPGAQRPMDRDLDFLRSTGIELLVSLTEEPLPIDELSSRGIEGLHLPVADFTAPTLDQLESFVAAAEESIAADRPVGIHCTAGLGRSGTFVAAFLVHRGHSASEAISEVRRLRPGSVETEEQEQRIGDFEKSSKDTSSQSELESF